MADSFYSFSEPLNSGVDFYNADDAKLISAAISIDGSVAISLTKIAFSAINASANTDALITARRIVFASANISDLLSTTVTAGTTIREGSLVVISATSSLTAVGTKIAYASSAINCTSSVVTVGMKISLASSAINSAASIVTSMVKTAFGSTNVVMTSNASTILTKIVFASAAINSSVILSIVGKISLATIRIAIQNMGSISAQAIKFAVNGIVDSSIIRTFMLIDDKPITNHNRKFESALEPIFVENKNWTNSRSRYYKSSARSGRKTFSLSWSWLPNSQEFTVDGKRGRDYIKEIASDPSHHVLKIVNLDESGVTPPTETSYNVLVKDYNETLTRRDLSNDVYFWDCSMTLEEV